MVGGLVETVDFKIPGHTLFLDEHFGSYGDQRFFTAVPGYFANVHVRVEATLKLETS